MYVLYVLIRKYIFIQPCRLQRMNPFTVLHNDLIVSPFFWTSLKPMIVGFVPFLAAPGLLGIKQSSSGSGSGSRSSSSRRALSLKFEAFVVRLLLPRLSFSFGNLRVVNKKTKRINQTRYDTSQNLPSTIDQILTIFCFVSKRIRFGPNFFLQ